MSERAKKKNHPQDPRQPPKIGSGRGKPAKGYDCTQNAWLSEEERCPKCGEPYVGKMRVPGDEVCFECRYPDRA